MGRIDDALRRSGAPSAKPAAPDAVATDAFVSPWTVDDDLKRDASSVSGPWRGAPPSTPTEDCSSGWRERLGVSIDSDPLLAHQFHRLAATLLQAQRMGRLKSVMITSASPQDGKTLVALNLALVLSGSYRLRVLLIEGDLRRPALAAAARLPLQEGLSEAINANDDRKVSLIQLSEALTLLPGGRPDPDPLSGLTSPRMQRLLQEAAEQFDWVILDTPPLGATADAGLLCPLVDAAILVVRAERTPHAAVQAAIETLGRERILGVVLNAVDHEVASGYDAQYAGHSKA